MRKLNAERLQKISNKAFNSVPLRELEGSLIQAGADKVVIASSGPATEDVLFGIHPGHLAKSKYVVLDLPNEEICFKIPSEILSSLKLSEGRITGRKLTTVKFDYDTHSWYLTCKKGSSSENGRLDIDIYRVDLLEEHEHMAICLGLRALLQSS
jgi:hypothetical protein